MREPEAIKGKKKDEEHNHPGGRKAMHGEPSQGPAEEEEENGRNKNTYTSKAVG